MKYFLALWLIPMSLFWAWFGLSYYDMNFGLSFLSRDIHNLVFGIYANLLGTDYETIVTGFIKACIFDSFIISAIVAYRKRKQIKAWWQQRKSSDDNYETNQESSVVAAE
ncbi:DUF6105 family protein [Ahrensia kielensis]|uniref:DUF6105 family protein n=1 Tax=Ahrensia kielensis TaxID=76980 RepID=UPI000363FF96|nr:DUF6105 family protein [Ahrensia kielensis]